MFRTQASLLKFALENGMKVIIRGYVSVFERDGQYQLYAEEIQPDGIGNLHMAFEQLKQKLKEEGLFDKERKKKLPLLPAAIGIVTSSTGAVIRDILNVLDRRFGNVNVKIIPVQVQGEHAAGQIAKAVRKFNELGLVDVIIVARGGGSLEELWAFNEEIVARSIYDSKITVISAVGHETDFTISDFVADLRAPTPSAAAEIVIPEKAALRSSISSLELRLKNALFKKAALSRARLQASVDNAIFRQPYNRIYQERMRLDVLSKYMYKAAAAKTVGMRAGLSAAAGKLQALSPLNIIARGYSVVQSVKDGKLVKSAEEVSAGDRLEVMLCDGRLLCTVDNIEKKIESGLGDKV
jgi:exodeoxyribonuclease VII large subunit